MYTINCCKESPKRPPDWRHWRATHLLETGQRPSWREDDPWIGKQLQFLRRAQSCETEADRDALRQCAPAFYYSRKYWTSDDESLKARLEARLLAGIPVEKIAGNLGPNIDIVRAYAALFFDVADCLPHRDYILHTVIGPRLQTMSSERSDWPILVRLIGYLRPDYLETFIRGGPLNVWAESPEAVGPALATITRGTLQVKALIAALTLPVNGATAPSITVMAQRLEALDLRNPQPKNDPAFRSGFDAMMESTKDVVAKVKSTKR